MSEQRFADVVEELRGKLRGSVFAPGDSGYESAVRVWNAMYDDRHPSAVLSAADEDDVVSAVRILATVEAPLAIRGGGHHIAGFGSCDDGFVIDLSAMRAASADPERALLRAAGGCTLHDVDTAAAAVGRAVPVGVVSETGVAGLTLSGGVGWLTRRFGYTCDNLVAARVVIADGEVVFAGEDENADLLWGLCGGGGNFGVVTEFEYRTHPVETVLVGEAYHLPRNEGEIEAILRFFRDWTMDASRDMTAWVAAERVGPQHGDSLGAKHGDLVVGFLACSLNTTNAGREEVAAMERFGRPVQAQIEPMALLDLQHIQDDSGAAAKGMRSYMKGEMLIELTDETIAGIAARCPDLPTAHSLFELGRIGGAMADRDEMDAAVGLREARYLGGFSMMGTAEDDVEAGIDWVREAWQVMRSGSAGGAYLNFDGEADDSRVLGSLGVGGAAEKSARLTETKRRYDPGNRFRINHNIKP